MRNLTLLLITFLIIAAASCKKNIIEEQEPNNSFSSANQIALDMPIEGFIDSIDDKDFYRLLIDRNSILDIRISGIKGVNLSLKIWKGQDQPILLKEIDDNRKSSPERIVNFFTEPDVYYITVLHGDRDRRKANRETPYRLIVSARDMLAEETEANDDRLYADTIVQGEELTGYFSPAYNRLNLDRDSRYREEDWFAINIDLESDEPLIMDVNISGVQGINSTLYLYGSDGRIITMADSSPMSLPESIKGIGIRESGNYYIMVTSSGYGSNPDEPYYLNVSLSPYDSSMEMEPNNSFAAASEIMNNEITGKINTPDDRDFYRYRSNNIDSVYRIGARSTENIDVKLRIFNKDHHLITEVNNSRKGESEIYPDLSINGDFYVIVSSKLYSSETDDTYSLLIEPLDDIKSIEIEPNNSKSEANTVLDDEIRGFISTGSDKDYYLLQYDRRIKVEFEIKGVKDGEIKLSITDPLGFILKSINVRDDNIMTFTEMVDKKGYLIVESVKESFNDPYEITLRGIK